MDNNKFKWRWTLGNALGMSIGFLAFLQLLNFLTYGFDLEKHWDFEATDYLDLSPITYALYIGLGLAFFGLIISAAQSVVLKKHISNIWNWRLNGAIGYILMLIIIFPLRGIWGEIEGPVEPFAIVLGGTIFMLILQWRLLKKQEINATKPLVLFILGAIIGIAVTFLLFTLGMNVSWALEIAIIGFITGTGAGLLSAKPFENALVKKTK